MLRFYKAQPILIQFVFNVERSNLKFWALWLLWEEIPSLSPALGVITCSQMNLLSSGQRPMYSPIVQARSSYESMPGFCSDSYWENCETQWAVLIRLSLNISLSSFIGNWHNYCHVIVEPRTWQYTKKSLKISDLRKPYEPRETITTLFFRLRCKRIFHRSWANPKIDQLFSLFHSNLPFWGTCWFEKLVLNGGRRLPCFATTMKMMMTGAFRCLIILSPVHNKMDAEAHSCPIYLNLFLYFPLARQFLKSGITFTSKNLLARPETS